MATDFIAQAVDRVEAYYGRPLSADTKGAINVLIGCMVFNHVAMGGDDREGHLYYVAQLVILICRRALNREAVLNLNSMDSVFRILSSAEEAHQEEGRLERQRRLEQLRAKHDARVISQ